METTEDRIAAHEAEVRDLTAAMPIMMGLVGLLAKGDPDTGDVRTSDLAELLGVNRAVLPPNDSVQLISAIEGVATPAARLIRKYCWGE